MKNIDLAVECSEVRGTPEGVTVQKEDGDGVKFITVTVSTEEGGKIIGKPVGKYITAELSVEPADGEELIKSAQAVAQRLAPLLPQGELLFFGRGNDRITPESLGPLTASQIIATRHLPRDMPELAQLRPVAAFSAGVMSQTGMETAEVIAALAAKLSPAAVVTVDALAARRLERLCKTVQISTAGISPGSGVGNRRSRIDSALMGCTVISIGVPLVVDGLTLACGVLGADEQTRDEAAQKLPDAESLMVTPQQIDKTVASAAKLLALAFNIAAQPSLDAATALSLM